MEPSAELKGWRTRIGAHEYGIGDAVRPEDFEAWVRAAHAAGGAKRGAAQTYLRKVYMGQARYYEHIRKLPHYWRTHATFAGAFIRDMWLRHRARYLIPVLRTLLNLKPFRVRVRGQRPVDPDIVDRAIPLAIDRVMRPTRAAWQNTSDAELPDYLLGSLMGNRKLKRRGEIKSVAIELDKAERPSEVSLDDEDAAPLEDVSIPHDRVARARITLETLLRAAIKAPGSERQATYRYIAGLLLRLERDEAVDDETLDELILQALPHAKPSARRDKKKDVLRKLRAS